MKVVVLSRNPRLYSTRRLVSAARRLHHTVKVIDVHDVTMMVSAGVPEAHYRGKPFPRTDAVIPRIGASVTQYGTAVVRQLDAMGMYVLNSADAILASRDKLRTLQLLSASGLDVPGTGIARRPELARGLLAGVGGPPVIVKLLEGTQGAGVIKVESRGGFNSTVDAFHAVGKNILVQTYLEANGSDLRVIVVGDRVVAAMRRTAQGDEFRSNVHRGGRVRAVRLDPSTRATAVKAARVLGLEFAGVDLIETPSGALVIEVNSSPGLEGIESATGVDLGEVVIHHLEAQVARLRARQKARISAATSRAAAARSRAAALPPAQDEPGTQATAAG